MTDAEGKGRKARGQCSAAARAGGWGFPSGCGPRKRQRVSRLSRKALVRKARLVALTLISRCRLLGSCKLVTKRAPPRPMTPTRPITTTLADQLSSLPKRLRRNASGGAANFGTAVAGRSRSSDCFGNRPNLVRLAVDPRAAGRANLETESARHQQGNSQLPLPVHHLVRWRLVEISTSGAASVRPTRFAQNGQDRKLAFRQCLGGSTNHKSRPFLAKPASPFMVQAGTVIPAAAHHGKSAPICRGPKSRPR